MTELTVLAAITKTPHHLHAQFQRNLSLWDADNKNSVFIANKTKTSVYCFLSREPGTI